MKILGIETSCDETAAAVIEGVEIPPIEQPTDADAMQGTDEQQTEPYMKYGEGAAQTVTQQSAASASGATGSAGRQASTVCRLLSNTVASSVDLHAALGGVVPEIAARSHIEIITPVIEEALGTAKTDWEQIDAIAVTQGPGLSGSLLIGVLAARTLAIIKNKPLYAINHVEAHVYANFITKTPLESYQLPPAPPQFPLLALIVSGGHSQLVLFKGHFDYILLGQTTDDAVGEAYDKVAKILGLPYPGGPSIEKIAPLGDPYAIKLPKAKMDSPYDFSFSGPKTAVLRAAQSLVGKDYTLPSVELPELLNSRQKADIAASFQFTAIDTLLDAALQAVKEYEPRCFVVAGGVAASQALRQQIRGKILSEVIYTDMKLCTDNAAMIAALGYFKIKHNKPSADPFSLEISPGLAM